MSALEREKTIAAWQRHVFSSFSAHDGEVSKMSNDTTGKENTVVGHLTAHFPQFLPGANIMCSRRTWRLVKLSLER